MNRAHEIVLTEICEPDIQPDSRDARRELLGFVQHFESPRPLLAAHMNHAKIRISSRHAGIDRQHLPELAFGIIKLTRMERGFSGFKQLLRIARRLRRSGPRLRRRRALDTCRIRYTTRYPTRKKKQ